MLSSLTSILPSGIGFSNKEERERERLDKERQKERAKERAAEANDDTPRANDNEGKLKESAVDEHGVKKKRERNPNETFIVVRPPPSVSNHPLNLQLQLVPPQSKDRSASGNSAASAISSYASRPSVDASEDIGDTSAQSIRSNRSDPTSFYASSSSASMSSIASTASTTSGGRRMIVPLYNLSAHNVMTNTVLDAGTDAKVAKFHKRGMEILGLAVLECVEIWPSYGRAGAGHVAFLNAIAPNGVCTVVGGPGAQTLDTDALLVTPTSSAISLSSAGSHPPYSHVQYTSHAHHPYMQQSLSSGTPKAPTPASPSIYGTANVTPTPSPSGAKRIFGKIFRKRDSSQLQVPSPESAIRSGGDLGPTGPGFLPGSTSGTVDIRAAPALASASRVEGGRNVREQRLSAGGASTSKHRSVNLASPTPSHFSIPPVSSTASSGGGGSTAAATSTNGVRNIKEQPQLQPAVLGIQPILSAPVIPPAGRPTRYIWIVRKWLKGGEGGLLGGVMRGVSMVGAGISSGMSGLGTGGGSNSASLAVQGQPQPGYQPEEMGVEVRFEWVRALSTSKEKRRARRSTGQNVLEKRGSLSQQQEDSGPGVKQSRRSFAGERPPDLMQVQEKSGRLGRGRPATASAGVGSVTPRLSGESRRSAEHTIVSHDSRTDSMTSALSDEAQGMLRNRGGVVEDDDGEESDPEDSETPWTCTLVVSSVPSNATRLWEHEHIERDGGLLGYGLTKKDSRLSSHLSRTADASSEASHPPPHPPPHPTPASTASSADPNPSLGARSASKPRPSTIDAPGTLLKIKVGALSPAPHHPKVVAQLKAPYPLPDVEVTRGRVRRRVLTPAGVARPVSRGEELGTSVEVNNAGGLGVGESKSGGGGGGNSRPKSRGGIFSSGFGNNGGNGNGGAGGAGRGGGGGGGGEAEGLVLTAEEIKDVLSCTAFWVVVREGFGGVGKVTRKGDGWRIRG